MERIVKRALGTRAVLVRALRRPSSPARPAKGVAHAASDEVTFPAAHTILPSCLTFSRSTLRCNHLSESKLLVYCLCQNSLPTSQCCCVQSLGWSHCSSLLSSSCFAAQVLLGVQLDAAAAIRPVDMGPAAEDTAAAADFRAFWGDKAELRRFPVRTRPAVVIFFCASHVQDPTGAASTLACHGSRALRHWNGSAHDSAGCVFDSQSSILPPAIRWE